MCTTVDLQGMDVQNRRSRCSDDRLRVALSVSCVVARGALNGSVLKKLDVGSPGRGIFLTFVGYKLDINRI